MPCNRRYYCPCATKNDFLKPWHPGPQASPMDTFQASALYSLDSPLLVSLVAWSAVGWFPLFCLFPWLFCLRLRRFGSSPLCLLSCFSRGLASPFPVFVSACFPCFACPFPPPAAGRPRLDDGAVSLCGCCGSPSVAYSPPLCLLVRLVRLLSSACPLSRLARSVPAASVASGGVWVLSHDAWHQRHWPCVGISLSTMCAIFSGPRTGELSLCRTQLA